MKLIEYFFYGIARCCFWILPGRALENGVPSRSMRSLNGYAVGCIVQYSVTMYRCNLMALDFFVGYGKLQSIGALLQPINNLKSEDA